MLVFASVASCDPLAYNCLNNLAQQDQLKGKAPVCKEQTDTHDKNWAQTHSTLERGVTQLNLAEEEKGGGRDTNQQLLESDSRCFFSALKTRA